jgi:hypothetical protein
VFFRAVLGLRPLAYRAGAALLAIAAGALGNLPELAGLAC